MTTSGYYDEIAKVEALRRQRLWRLGVAKRVTRRAKQQTNGAVSASFQKRPSVPSARSERHSGHA